MRQRMGAYAIEMQVEKFHSFFCGIAVRLVTIEQDNIALFRAVFPAVVLYAQHAAADEQQQRVVIAVTADLICPVTEIMPAQDRVKIQRLRVRCRRQGDAKRVGQNARTEFIHRFFSFSQNRLSSPQIQLFTF